MMDENVCWNEKNIYPVRHINLFAHTGVMVDDIQVYKLLYKRLFMFV